MSETHSPDAKVPSGSSSKKNEADTSDAEVVDLKESGTINGCLTTLEKTVEKLRYTLSMRHPYRRRHARGVAVIWKNHIALRLGKGIVGLFCYWAWFSQILCTWRTSILPSRTSDGHWWWVLSWSRFLYFSFLSCRAGRTNYIPGCQPTICFTIKRIFRKENFQSIQLEFSYDSIMYDWFKLKIGGP